MSNLTSFQKAGKTILYIIILLVVLGVTIVLGKTASGIFTAKASTCDMQNVSAVAIKSNSAVINWVTSKNSQGRVEYGTTNTSFTFSQLEGAEGTVHNVPLTLLTPNTTYYYVINISNQRCDSQGQLCTDKCIPWQFTTSSVNADVQTPSAAQKPSLSVNPTTSSTPSATNQLSSFCKALVDNTGETNTSASWVNVKQYDLDSNGIINSKDAILCQDEKR